MKPKARLLGPPNSQYNKLRPLRKKTYVGSFNQELAAAVLNGRHVRDTVDGVLGQLRTILVESGNFLLDIILQQISVSLLVA